MQDIQENKDTPSEAINPDIHPSSLRFSIWDRTNAIEVTISEAIIIGRSADEEPVAVDLTDYHGRLLGVSRRHALIFPTATGMAIRDLDSANGTKHRGEALKKDQVYDLHHGDELQIGGLYITVFFVD